MITCSPQRYLANNRNVLRTAMLTPSSVQPIDGQVLSIPFPRKGTAQVALTGSYSGNEEAVYDVQIVDDGIDTNLISAPIFAGAGSGKLDNIVASGTAQNYTVELSNAGDPMRAAFVDFEGVKIVARIAGAAGNNIRLLIDQSALEFTPTTFSLLADLPAGSGSDTAGLEGAAFDWDAQPVGSDNQIPASAHRISFGDDKSTVYLQYKRFDGTKWTYSFVPQIQRDIPKGTLVNFVTLGRTVTVTEGGSPPDEEFFDVVTVFDLLEALKLGSALVDVVGVVANDRSPTGQAARELALRTDARTDPSYGSGGAATGLIDTEAAPGAGTELVEITCYAVTGRDDPAAHLGKELWKVKGSLLGDQGIATTGIPFVSSGSPPSWGFTIPQRLPDGYGQPHGSFSVVSESFPRPPGTELPKVCMVALELGPDAVDQQVTLTWTARPSGDCLCDKMAIPDLRTPCLGLFDDGGGPMAYSDAAAARLVALYDWAATLAAGVTKYVAGLDFLGIPTGVAGSDSDSFTMTASFKGVNMSGTQTGGTHASGEIPIEESPVTTGYADVALPPDFQDVVDDYENAIAAIDAVPNAILKAAGFAQWDLALAAWQDDFGGTQLEGLGNRLNSIATAKYAILTRQAQAYAGIPQVGKADADSILSGDGCWRDWGDAFYWEVVGSDGGKYAPAFNNHPYYSSRATKDGQAYYSTHEFAFQPNVKCPGLLEVGDQITLSIGGAGFSSTYQVGDKLWLPVISAQPFYLAGGQDGDDTQKWYVTGSIDGPLAPFTYSLAGGEPHSYSSGSPGGLSFDITDGGIPFAGGDRFTFGIEGAHYQWRKNGSAWSSSLPVPLTPVAFDSGLSIQFTTGSAPSFVALDTFSFRALQPWAVSNIQSPSDDRWQWVGDTPTLLVDCGTVIDGLDGLGIGFHTLPPGSTVVLQGGVLPGIYDWTEVVTWRVGPIVQPFVSTHSARYLLFSLTGVTDAGIGWAWVGQMMSTEKSADVLPTLSYKIIRQSVGLRSVGRYIGKTVSGGIEWSEGSLTEADVVNLVDTVDWLKSNDDEAFLFVPQISRPDEAMLVQVGSDDLDLPDLSSRNRDAAYARDFSATLPLVGVF